MTAKQNQAKTPQPKTKEELLIEELAKHYGVEYRDDQDKFIKDITKSSKERTKQFQDKPDITEAKFEEKIGELRMVWTDGTPERGETKQQKDLRKALKDADIVVSLEFPDDNSWRIVHAGKEDSGTMTMSTQQIVAKAQQLVEPEALT